jgi:hypothetical protein
MKSPKSPSAPTPAGSGGVRLWANIIIDGVHYSAGTMLPYTETELCQRGFRRYIDRAESPKSVTQRGRQLNFRTGVLYDLDDQGRLLRGLGRDVARQIGEMEAAADERENVEEALSEPPNEALVAAMEQAQDAHDAAVGRELAEAQYLAKQNDDTRRSLSNKRRRMLRLPMRTALFLIQILSRTYPEFWRRHQKDRLNMKSQSGCEGVISIAMELGLERRESLTAVPVRRFMCAMVRPILSKLELSARAVSCLPALCNEERQKLK